MTQRPQRPLVLLSNDDGHDSPGIRAVRDAVSTFADVVICAPSTNQSATSHSLTLHRPLRLKQVELLRLIGNLVRVIAHTASLP